MKSKLCKYCDSDKHTSIMCFSKPRRPIRKIGKQTQLWIETRKEWIEKNPSDRGVWFCRYCSTTLTFSTLTLDHMLPRGSHPHKRFELANLVPCCSDCNLKKGSRSYYQYMEYLSSGKM